MDLPKIDSRERTSDRMKPSTISSGANAVSLKATSCAVTVVPTLAPKITPTLFLNDNTPALTRLTAMTEVAELDWMTAVTRAPMSRPNRGILVARARNLRKRSPEICWISAEKFSRPKINRMTAVRPARSTCRCSM